MNETVKLSEIATIHHGYAFEGQFFTDQETPHALLTPGNFHVEKRLYFGKNTKYYNGPIPEDYILENGDLLVVMTDLTKDMAILGTAVILESDKTVLHNQRIGKVKLKRTDISKQYLCYLLNSEDVLKEIKSTASGTTVRHTSPSRILNNTVSLPTWSEQTKIAQILSTWDKAIATTERLLANSQQQKQALMQQLLTGTVRFPNAESEWYEVEIGNIIKEVKRPVAWDDDAQYRLLSVKRRAEGVVLREVLAGSQILTKKMNTARAGDFLISKMQVTHGAMGLVTDEFDNHHISDSYIAVIAKDTTKLDINFFSWLGRTKALWRLAFLSSYGVHIEKLTFNFSLFLKEKICIPTSLAEQQKIAQVLSTADAEITNLQAQLAKLKLEKKALMQQLLTGQRRVKLDDEVEETQIRRVG
ncbi:restriction endonuclease subunit S [Pseudomonas sp.]|uniref:restriction endonuclease subunit S n=1 Tax=Pseudomonas sp. TaxID=306 RepID=UPI0027349355|nr:restriction endonuclease subunit S [Pseudomonas sp.]MDP3815337.1 restriction endonuclease subunit S [Pseudomonas sp.]